MQADLPSAAQHIARVRAALPRQPAVAVSAATERWLCQQRRAGRVAYVPASRDAQLAAGDAAAGSVAGMATIASTSSVGDADVEKRVRAAWEGVLKRYGSTGVLAALTCAMAMRPPAVAYPVADLETFAALVAHAGGGGGGPLGAGQDAKHRAAEGANTGAQWHAVHFSSARKSYSCSAHCVCTIDRPITVRSRMSNSVLSV